jgi:hypothetical protein
VGILTRLNSREAGACSTIRQAYIDHLSAYDAVRDRG